MKVSRPGGAYQIDDSLRSLVFFKVIRISLASSKEWSC